MPFLSAHLRWLMILNLLTSKLSERNESMLKRFQLVFSSARALTVIAHTVNHINILRQKFHKLCSIKQIAEIIYDGANERRYYFNRIVVRSIELTYEGCLTKKFIEKVFSSDCRTSGPTQHHTIYFWESVESWFVIVKKIRLRNWISLQVLATVYSAMKSLVSSFNIFHIYFFSNQLISNDKICIGSKRGTEYTLK